MNQDHEYWGELRRIDREAAEVTVQMRQEGIKNEEWERLEDLLYDLKQQKRALQRQKAKDIRSAK